MDHKENIHLEIAEALLNERELAKNISRAIYNALDALDAQLMRMVKLEIDKAEYYDGDLYGIQSYCHERMNELMVLAGVYTFNPNGCTGEQTYKFIQEFTQIKSVVNDPGNLYLTSNFTNYSQGQFNALTDDDLSDEDCENIEEVYNEKAYHEFTGSGGCRD